jgi:hypothetical protein
LLLTAGKFPGAMMGALLQSNQLCPLISSGMATFSAAVNSGSR